MDKVQKAAAVNGPSYLHVLSVCPTGWRCPTDQTIKIGRLAVETGVFPLYEIVNGERRLTVRPSKLKPVTEYLKLQGRFGHLSEGIIAKIQERVTREYEEIAGKAEVQAEPVT